MGMITPSGGWDRPVQRPQAPSAVPVVYAPAPVTAPQIVYVQIAERRRHGFLWWCVVLLLLAPVLPFGLMALPVILPVVAIFALVTRSGNRRSVYTIRN